MDREEIERGIIRLVAADRLDIPISSLSGKLKRTKPKLAEGIILPGGTKSFNGERAWVRIEEKEEEERARTMREAIDVFKEKHPKQGEELEVLIEERRKARNSYLFFGVKEGSRLSADDYLTVMSDLGFGEASARSLYHELIEVSRNIKRKREETERSIMLGTTLGQ